MFSEWLYLSEAQRQLYFDFMKVPTVSKLDVQSRKLFGPVFHGTDEEKRLSIQDTGFRIHVGDARQGNVSNGYKISNYARSIPAPVHHLGFGIYFTTVRSIGTMYNNNERKLDEYYLDVPKLKVINFGSENTMMKWWIDNGYDMEPVKNFSDPEVVAKRIQATVHLTDHLKSQYDAVWFTGKGMFKRLDGDQIVVFDPNRIYRYDPNKEREQLGVAVGDRVKIRGCNCIAKVKNIVFNPGAIVKDIGDDSPFALAIDKMTNPGLFADYYGNYLRRFPSERRDDLVKMRIERGMSPEQALDSAISFMIMRLSEMIPSNFVEKVFKKGERIPRGI